MSKSHVAPRNAAINNTDPPKDIMVPKDMIASAVIWDIFSPPPGNTIKGSLMPKAIAKLSSDRRRRLCVEIHRVYTAEGRKKTETNSAAPPESALPQNGVFLSSMVEDHDDYYEECFVRLLIPEKSAISRDSKRNSKKKQANCDNVILPAAGDDVSILRDDDDESAFNGQGGAIADCDGISNLPSYKGWKAKYKLPITAISIKQFHKKVVKISIELCNIKHTRDLIFDSEQEAGNFVQIVDIQKEAEREHSAIKLRHALGGLKISPGEEVTLLVEIVSGAHLPVGDRTSSDPFVMCFFNGREVHRTDFISKNLDPVWTVKTGSLFLITLSTKELFMSDGLLCEVADFDKLGANEMLGAINVPPKTLFDSSGERMTFTLQKSSRSHVNPGKGSLTIRVRHATANDKKFMKELEEAKNKSKRITLINAQVLEKVGGKSDIRSLVERVKKTEKRPDGSWVKKYRVRPHPDPTRKEETEWLSKQQVEAEVFKESKEWVDISSGDVATVFVEIICCDGLPNLDNGGFLGNKTDAFVALVFEDSWAQTDVIADTLHPRWFPWSRRAFIFHQSHSSSQLFLGVFDEDGSLSNHDLIGRVSVDLSNLRPSTVYTLTYDIFPSARMTDRNSQGSITIRLRMEIDDEKKLLTSCLEPPRTQYVNVKKRKQFKVIQYTCTGKYDEEKCSRNVIMAYCDELMTYQSLWVDVKRALVSLIFWRGQFDVEFMGNSYMLPVHSMIAFLVFVLLVERPLYIPSFFFASIAWLMLAIMFQRLHNPNPWRRCKSFLELFLTLVIGSSGTGPLSIKANENKAEAVAFEERLRQRIMDAEAASLKAAKEAEEEQALAEKEAEEIGETNIDISKQRSGGRSIDPYRKIMEPIQINLQIICKIIRYIRNILIWEECYLSFWLTICCVILSIACMFVPWAFLVLWTSRFIVWTFFGPWMKLADVYYYMPIENMTEEEIERRKENYKMNRRLNTQAKALEARIERENAQKLKDMKKLMFGKFIMKVPVFKEDRWRDTPLPQSKAEPYVPKSLALAELAMQEAGYHRIRVPGQHLEGDMIPTIQLKAFTDAPVGQATKLHAEKESDSVAYAMIGSVVAGAAAITWFGIPFLASLAQGVVGS